ncbi:MAG: N-acetylneuraminate synthase family protein [Planctomycetota bacterium]
MRIADRGIGASHPPYIIAEIGVNHDGDADRALMLVERSAEAGADAVKFQYFETDRLLSSASKLAAYQKAAGESDPVAMLRRLELSIDALAAVVERAHACDIHAIVTVFSVELVDAADRLPWDAYKTASPDIIHKPLLDRLGATGRPVIVSTGASTLDEVTRAVGTDGAATADNGWLGGVRDRLAVLQCVSNYPAEQESLGGIATLAQATGLPVGYSDHRHPLGLGSAAGAQRATMAGAVILERHVTDDRSRPGPDHAASAPLLQLPAYIERARHGAERRTTATAKAWREGLDPGKTIAEEERDVRVVSRQSIVTRRALAAGHQIEASDLTFKRPGTGVPPYATDMVLGRVLARAVEADVPLRYDDVA